MKEKIDRLHAGGKTLENLFFFEKDLTLLEKKKQLQKMERSLQTLSEISGISDEALLRKLVDFNIQIEVLATLSIIPLVEIAWADGKIDENERAEILKAAESFGVFKGQVNRDLFEHWLTHHPPKGMIESWIYYMQGLCQLLSKKERSVLKAGFLQWAKKIGEAGTGEPQAKAKTARRKKEILLQLEQAFEPLSYHI